MQAKDRELAEAQRQLTRAEETIRREQQQLREKVNGVKCVHNVWCVTRGPPDCRRNS